MIPKCPQCGNLPLYYSDCDTFGCPECDVWTERPHRADCCRSFEPSPERPSLYKGEIENIYRTAKKSKKTVKRV